MSSFQDPLLVVNELSKYIRAHGERDRENNCWKINAGPKGWGKFFENNPHLKDTDRKPKKFCEAHSPVLSWLSDDSADGKGYITVPEAAAKNPSARSITVAHQPCMSAIVRELIGGSLSDVTITNDHESKMVHLTGKTSSKKETISVEKKVIA